MQSFESLTSPCSYLSTQHLPASMFAQRESQICYLENFNKTLQNQWQDVDWFMLKHYCQTIFLCISNLDSSLCICDIGFPASVPVHPLSLSNELTTIVTTTSLYSVFFGMTWQWVVHIVVIILKVVLYGPHRAACQMSDILTVQWSRPHWTVITPVCTEHI